MPTTLPIRAIHGPDLFIVFVISIAVCDCFAYAAFPMPPNAVVAVLAGL